MLGLPEGGNSDPSCCMILAISGNGSDTGAALYSGIWTDGVGGDAISHYIEAMDIDMFRDIPRR